MQRAAPLLVVPDIPVNRFVADREKSEPCEPAHDLRGPVVLAEHRFDQRPLCGTELRIPTRASPPFVSVRFGHATARTRVRCSATRCDAARD